MLGYVAAQSRSAIHPAFVINSISKAKCSTQRAEVNDPVETLHSVLIRRRLRDKSNRDRKGSQESEDDAL
jgi:hypothetical protein